MSFLALWWPLAVRSPLRNLKNPQEVLGDSVLWTGLTVNLSGTLGSVELPSLGLITVPAKTVCCHRAPISALGVRGSSDLPIRNGLTLSPPPCLILPEGKLPMFLLWAYQPFSPCLTSAYPPYTGFRGARGCWPLTAQALALCIQVWQWHLLPNLSTSLT